MTFVCPGHPLAQEVRLVCGSVCALTCKDVFHEFGVSRGRPKGESAARAQPLWGLGKTALCLQSDVLVWVSAQSAYLQALSPLQSK